VDAPEIIEVTDLADLRALMGEPLPRAAAKDSAVLQPAHQAWVAASPFVLVATSDADGRCDVSPKGDPAGSFLVLDERTLVVGERPGNRRADGFVNVLVNPHVGLLFVIPGRGDTLRVNGRARVVRDGPFFDDLVVSRGGREHRPVVALLVDVEQAFFHCSKAFLRSRLWEPDTWTPDALPSRARLVKQVERTDETLEELETYYGPAYADRLYR
jgi:PPOX class probable FMN-dependent enzyme